jgi:phosphoribosylaminoimidazolecarboxamide formyltransferase/IMP cyclohydrolase
MAKQALISVYDKEGIETFATSLHELGYEIVSSGGTSNALAKAGIPHTNVEDLTGAPEMLGGRVKTLHPKIHGGILADLSKPDHVKDLESQQIEPFEIVVCNLYPFRSNPSIELIDVGGPTMVRGAAKNHAHVAVIVDPSDYGNIIEELKSNGKVSAETRQELAKKAFAHTAAYDAAITKWFEETSGDDKLPSELPIVARRAQSLRYGENPHQQGARYVLEGSESWWDTAIQHGGKELSYLNIYDTEAAWRLVNELSDRPVVAIIKHANPCGVAANSDITEAYVKANACDPVSAFGGIVAINRPVPLALAEKLAEVFTEVVVAPGYEPGALDVLLSKKNMRVLEATSPQVDHLEVRSISGGLLVHETDRINLNRSEWKAVTKKQPSDSQLDDMELAWVVCAYTKSNAIVLAKDGQCFGIGAGQQSRVDAARIAASKADGRAQGGVAASDAFFPFRDGLDAVADAGAVCIIQPGGSVHDDEVIAAADERHIAMVFTGERHFRH